MNPNKQLRIGLLIVGDELLSGKRSDSHTSAVIARLRVRGLGLAWIRVVGDDEADIADVVRQCAADGSVLICCGGIGGTPDDRTRQAAALALQRQLVLHPEASRLIEERYGERARPQRMRMAEFPEGSTIIPNPVNQVAGFSVDRLHFVPGFPEMAWPMIEWVLDSLYADHHRDGPETEHRLRITGDATEGDFVDLMEACGREFPGVRVSSLPSRGAAPGQGHIEFGFCGDAAQTACNWFEAQAGKVDGARVEVISSY